jgi:hypothetical protein
MSLGMLADDASDWGEWLAVSQGGGRVGVVGRTLTQ